VSIRIPDAAVLLVALAVGGLAIYRGNAVIAVVCLSIAAVYAAVIVWRRRSRGDRE
jgi:membrane protein implicated in regulation of membrane protease activity